MSRFSVNEFSLERIANAFGRRWADFPDWLGWNLPAPDALLMRVRLESLVDLHRGERCVVIGNGPSLAAMDLSVLKSEFTFGLNRIYLLFERFSFIPTYYVCMNELVLEQFGDDISKLPMTKFLNWNRRRLFDQKDPSIICPRLSLSFNDRFNRDVRRPFYSGGTVTFVALQLAFIMGFSEVILIGVDHSFSDKGIPNKIELRRTDTDPNHFDPNYFPRGFRWQFPDLKRSEIAYGIARGAFEADHRKIVDATVNGKCPVFEKVEFESLF